MIITLKGADFSTNKIGTLSNWTVTPVIDSGTTYSGVRSIEKTNPVFEATLTLVDGYAYSDGITVTMGGGGTVTQSTSGNVTTLSCSNVTGNITIKALTYNTSTGESGSGSGSGTTEDESGTETTKYAVTVTTTPATASISIKEGTLTTGTTIAEGTGSCSVDVDPNTEIGVVATCSGYYSKSETLTVTQDTTIEYTLEAMNKPDGENIVTQGTLYEGKSLSSISYSMSDNESYYVYDQIPVEAGGTYTVSNGLRAWWLNDSKTKISTINFKNTNYVATAPSNAAYVSITFPVTVDPSEAFVVKTA